MQCPTTVLQAANDPAFACCLSASRSARTACAILHWPPHLLFSPSRKSFLLVLMQGRTCRGRHTIMQWGSHGRTGQGEGQPQEVCCSGSCRMPRRGHLCLSCKYPATVCSVKQLDQGQFHAILSISRPYTCKRSVRTRQPVQSLQSKICRRPQHHSFQNRCLACDATAMAL